MKVLDCESTESAYASLETILGVSRGDIDALIGSLDKRAYYSTSDEAIFEAITGSAAPRMDFDRVYWVHLTRTTPGNNFEQGILPLGPRLDSIWDFLYSLISQNFSESEWAVFRQSISDKRSFHLSSSAAHDYNLKTNDPFHWGPYAFLIRDIAFKGGSGDYGHYLRAPEVIENIYNCFAERYGPELEEAYTKSTQPCVVKFIDDRTKPSYVPEALHYLWHAYHGEELGVCGITFDGEGETVPPDRILKVEFIAPG
jgi:hypothetical protein